MTACDACFGRSVRFSADAGLNNLFRPFEGIPLSRSKADIQRILVFESWIPKLLTQKY
jgi:hypothetical protein